MQDVRLEEVFGLHEQGQILQEREEIVCIATLD